MILVRHKGLAVTSYGCGKWIINDRDSDNKKHGTFQHTYYTKLRLLRIWWSYVISNEDLAKSSENESTEREYAKGVIRLSMRSEWIAL